MSLFKVSIEKVATVTKHPNADQLEICTLKSYPSLQFITAKGKYTTDIIVVYFPLDSVLPADILEKLQLTGKLKGKDKNRVQTICLRGSMSQGLIIPVCELFNEQVPIGTDVTERLQVVKYEPPVVPCHNANLLPLPCGLKAYDLEGCDRFQDILEILMDKVVCITEKVEGANFSVTATPSGELWVNQRNFTIQPKSGSEHDFWRVASSQGLIQEAKTLASLYLENVTIYGEFIGPGYQGNIYKRSLHQVLVFDVKVGNSFMDASRCIELFQNMYVPILSMGITLREWLNGKTIHEASSGSSKLLSSQLREGIVVKPIIDEYVTGFGRLILKQRDPVYLSKCNM